MQNSSNPTPIALLNARLIDPKAQTETRGGVYVERGMIVGLGAQVSAQNLPSDVRVVECGGDIVSPGLIDMRAFVGEPGAEHRETIATASAAAAAGGVTTIIAAPETSPPVDDTAVVDFLMRRARDSGGVRVLPCAALTKGLEGREISEIGLLTQAGAVAFGDGKRSLANAQVMRRAMTYAKDFDALIVSSSQSLDVIRRAKAQGLPVTCGVSINHLSLNENDIGDYRTFLKLRPPLRSEDERLALVEALEQGLIDVVMSDHDPQDVETKRLPFAEAEAGAIGVETMLSAGLRLVQAGLISLPRLLATMTTAPADILRLPQGRLAIGAPADLIRFDPEEPWVVDPVRLRSRCKNTPFDEARMEGRVKLTLVAGAVAHE